MKRCAYFVVNDSDDLDALQSCVDNYGSGNLLEQITDTVIDYFIDKRRIIDLIKHCDSGDIIYTPVLARIGRSLKDLYLVLSIANERDVEMIFCDKPYMTFCSKSITGQLNMESLKWAVDMDFEIRSECNSARAAKQKDDVQRLGAWISKDGRAITKLGRPPIGYGENGKPIYDVSAMQEASSRVRTDKAIQWRDKSEAVAVARRKRAEGWTLQQIVDELGCMFDDYAKRHPGEPNIYATPAGCKPMRGTISKWLKDTNEN